MAKREFCQLSHTYNPAKHRVNFWYASEKIDGLRCIWDGGVTSGYLAAHIQWANTEKDDRYTNPPKATGLWTRRGKPIQAPDWFLNQLPVGIPLDGELYAGIGSFQSVSSTVRDLSPGPGWAKVKFHVFDSPAYRTLFAPGQLSYGTSKKKYSFDGVLEDYLSTLKEDRRVEPSPFVNVYHNLLSWRLENQNVVIHPQARLDNGTDKANQQIQNFLRETVRLGGEGIVLRNPFTAWEACRSYNCLKYKPEVDDEARVIGYTWGRETELGSKLLGLMGNVIVLWRGKEFELSGFTEAERVMHVNYAVIGDDNEPFEAARRIGEANPGKPIDHRFIGNMLFPIGSIITFKYSGRLTEDGIPKEARYYRRRND